MHRKPFSNEALKELCRATGLNQTKFAARIGVPHRTLVLIMAGQRRLTGPMAELIFLHTGGFLRAYSATLISRSPPPGSHTPPTFSKTGTGR